MPTCDFAETVTVDPHHLAELLKTVAHVNPAPGLLKEAAQELMDTLLGQVGGDAWRMPAEALWIALHYSHSMDVYDLDECDAASYSHPALLAEEHVQRQLMEQAPRTDAAMEAVSEAGLALLLGIAEKHVPYLYESSTVREQRCLTCETTYPCQARQTLES